jgi:hypothetical protein
MTVTEVLALPASVDIVTAGRALGLCRDTAYRLAADGGFPAPVIRVGRRWVVPRAGLLRALGLDEAARSA